MQKEQNVRLVLASASPRRRELLSQIGLEFTVMPSTKEENAKTTEAGALVQELSRQKAVDNWEQLSGGQGQNPDADQEQISEETQEPNLNGKRQPELLVIGADTVVCCEGKILGKPHSREAAAEMLTALQGRSHEVYTGVTLYSQSETVTFFECTQVEFYPMTEVEISEYIDSKEYVSWERYFTDLLIESTSKNFIWAYSKKRLTKAYFAPRIVNAVKTIMKLVDWEKSF